MKESNMNLRAQHLSETCSDPIEYLRQLRQTTEPIGGSTVYDEDDELVEYEVAIEAVKKANKAFIEKACKYIGEHVEYYMKKDKICHVPLCPQFATKSFIEDFKNYMKGE